MMRSVAPPPRGRASECSLWGAEGHTGGVCSFTSTVEGCSLAERDSSRVTTSRGHCRTESGLSLTHTHVCEASGRGTRWNAVQFLHVELVERRGPRRGASRRTPPAGLGVSSCGLEVSMRRRSGDVGVLVVSLMHFVGHVFAQWESTPHELCIIASLTVFVVCCFLLFLFSFFLSSWYSCNRHMHIWEKAIP